MKIKSVIGLLIIAISILTFSVQISIGKLAMYIDQTTSEYWTDSSKYIPNMVYVFIIIAIGIGAYLIFSKDDADKK